MIKKTTTTMRCIFALTFVILLLFAKTTLALLHSYADAVARISPAVVSVYPRLTRVTSAHRDLHGSYLYSTAAHPMLTATRHGSGVIISSDGYILTNNHVVSQAKHIAIVLKDGRRFDAIFIGKDADTDLSVLKIKIKNPPVAPIGSSKNLRVGDVVLAIGNPFALGQTVTQGIISALGRSDVGMNQLESYIQTDAVINPGNSGGALINASGDLIGINTGIYSKSGSYQGIAFSIPIDVAMHVFRQIKKFGHVRRGWLDLDLRTITSQLVQKKKLANTYGVLVLSVEDASLKKYIRANDIIVKVDGYGIHNVRRFISTVAYRHPGSSVELELYRRGKLIKLSVPVSEHKATIRSNNSDYPDSRVIEG